MNLMVVVMFEVYQYKIVHLIIGIGSNYIWGVGANVIYTVIAAICAACINLNKVSRVKYWGGPSPPLPPVPTPMLFQLQIGLINGLKKPLTTSYVMLGILAKPHP